MCAIEKETVRNESNDFYVNVKAIKAMRYQSCVTLIAPKTRGNSTYLITCSAENPVASNQLR